MGWRAILGTGVIWLGAAVMEPSSGHTHSQGLEHLTPAETRSNRNWHSFWRNHLGEWTGTWTRYTPSGDVKETFASSRRFTADSAQTEVVQVNRYLYADGHAIRKEWSFNIDDHSQINGFAHPASESIRGLALDNGAAAWLIPHLQRDKIAPFELFLVDGDIRHSVGVLYGTNGQLIRTTSIREQRGKPANNPWTTALVQVDPWIPEGQWQGKAAQIRQDLSRVPIAQSTWQRSETNQANHFFPDGIILRCPEQLVAGQPFAIQVIWMVNADELQTITAEYNSAAELIAVTHQGLSPDS